MGFPCGLFSSYARRFLFRRQLALEWIDPRN
jgi:hypothetical protein